MVDYKDTNRFITVCRDTSQSISYPVCHAYFNSCIIHTLCSALLMLVIASKLQYKHVYTGLHLDHHHPDILRM